MSALVACPQCAVVLDVPDDLLGKQVRCATCSTIFDAVAKETAPPGEASDPLRPSEGAEKREARDEGDARGEGESDRHELRQRRWGQDADDDDFDDDYRGSRRRMRRDLEPHRATTILVMGVLSLVMPFACGLIGTIVGIVLGLLATVMGNRDLRKIRSGTMDPDGQSQTRTGVILGYVGLGISAVCFLACGAYLVVLLAMTISQGR